MDKKEEKKNKIISSSIHLMYLNGYNGTSVKDITEAAKIPKGSFYNYFKDKEQYAVDALNYYQFVMRKDRLDIFTDKNLAPLDRIRKFYKKGIESLKDNDLKLGCFVGNLSQEMGDVSLAIAQSANSFHSRVTEYVYSNLVEAKINGCFSKNVNLRALASFIVSSWNGSLLRMKTSKNSLVLEDFYYILDTFLLS